MTMPDRERELIDTLRQRERYWTERLGDDGGGKAMKKAEMARRIEELTKELDALQRLVADIDKMLHMPRTARPLGP